VSLDCTRARTDDALLIPKEQSVNVAFELWRTRTAADADPESGKWQRSNFPREFVPISTEDEEPSLGRKVQFRAVIDELPMTSILQCRERSTTVVGAPLSFKDRIVSAGSTLNMCGLTIGFGWSRASRNDGAATDEDEGSSPQISNGSRETNGVSNRGGGAPGVKIIGCAGPKTGDAPFEEG
jgi:hypothetical protein